jgi:hypothetical protein
VLAISIILLDPEHSSEVVVEADGSMASLPHIFPASPNVSELDAKRLLWGLQQTRSIMQTAPMVSLAGAELRPGDSLGHDGLVEWVS